MSHKGAIQRFKGKLEVHFSSILGDEDERPDGFGADGRSVQVEV